MNLPFQMVEPNELFSSFAAHCAYIGTGKSPLKSFNGVCCSTAMTALRRIPCNSTHCERM